MDFLDTITALSHAFGTSTYVKGGGGNTSCKDADTLWVKPSGTTLAHLEPQSFVALDRAKLGALYAMAIPPTVSARERLVQESMAAAVKTATTKRASVEAPLHDSLAARYVVHTHPAPINALTCAIGGESAAARLFPEALWMPYIDPGYTLCMEVRKAVQRYHALKGREPQVILLENHGVFVAGDTPTEIYDAYAQLIDTLQTIYRAAQLPLNLVTAAAPPPELVKNWQATLTHMPEVRELAVSGHFEVAAGPLTPDHIVYAKSYPFQGLINSENLRAFHHLRGYQPRVIATTAGVIGLGETKQKADLTLELAQDGALVKQLAYAFGGVKYLSERARDFIENWEAESYRAQQIA